jgi:hypothetical protein
MAIDLTGGDTEESRQGCQNDGASETDREVKRRFDLKNERRPWPYRQAVASWERTVDYDRRSKDTNAT